MNNFFKNNVISIIGLVITCGGLLIHIGMTQAKIEATHKELAEFKSETKEKIREMEILSRATTERIYEKLDALTVQMTKVVTLLEQQQQQKSPVK